MTAPPQSMSEFLDDLWSDLGTKRPTGQNSTTETADAQTSTAVAEPTADAGGSSNATAAQQGVRRPTASPSQQTSVNRPAPVPQQAPTRAAQQASPVRRSSPVKSRSKGPLFYPKAPVSLKAIELSDDMVGRLLIKFLAARGASTGRTMSAHIRLGLGMVEEVLQSLRREQLLALKGDAVAGDYTYVITEKGTTLSKELNLECTYFGAAPVSLQQYLEAMKLQSVADQVVRAADLQRAFSDLLLDEKLLKILGPAINSGRGLFLFGEPGNGKTSIAERIVRAFGTTIWIPRALGLDGQVIRLFDPAIHNAMPYDPESGEPQEKTEIDQRWVKIQRPTVIAGGELTMSELEVCQDPNTHICEAPLQLKSNGGVLLIDDFGRQRMPVDELLNRWIVPLEKRYDLLNLPSGKKVQVPFDQLVIFSTNLEPKDLVDDAFLRRIPYKVEVPNPTQSQFHKLFKIMCKKFEIAYEKTAIDHLLREHYVNTGRELRACHPRDLLLQVRNHCLYEELELKLTKETMDFAVASYFSVLS